MNPHEHTRPFLRSTPSCEVLAFCLLALGTSCRATQPAHSTKSAFRPEPAPASVSPGHYWFTLPNGQIVRTEVYRKTLSELDCPLTFIVTVAAPTGKTIVEQVVVRAEPHAWSITPAEAAELCISTTPESRRSELVSRMLGQ